MERVTRNYEDLRENLLCAALNGILSNPAHAAKNDIEVGKMAYYCADQAYSLLLQSDLEVNAYMSKNYTEKRNNEKEEAA